MDESEMHRALMRAHVATAVQKSLAPIMLPLDQGAVCFAAAASIIHDMHLSPEDESKLVELYLTTLRQTLALSRLQAGSGARPN